MRCRPSQSLTSRGWAAAILALASYACLDSRPAPSVGEGSASGAAPAGGTVVIYDSAQPTDDPGLTWCANSLCTNLVLTREGRPAGADDVAALEEAADHWAENGCGCFGRPVSGGSPNGTGDLCQLSILIDLRQRVLLPALLHNYNDLTGRLVSVSLLYPGAEPVGGGGLANLFALLIDSDCRLNFWDPPQGDSGSNSPL